MSATSVGVAPSGECLRSKGRYDSCRWQVKLCDLIPIGPYQRFTGGVYDEALHKSTFFTFLLYIVPPESAPMGLILKRIC